LLYTPIYVLTINFFLFGSILEVRNPKNVLSNLVRNSDSPLIGKIAKIPPET
jgi:hypothetical protein